MPPLTGGGIERFTLELKELKLLDMEGSSLLPEGTTMFEVDFMSLKPLCNFCKNEGAFDVNATIWKEEHFTQWSGAINAVCRCGVDVTYSVTFKEREDVLKAILTAWEKVIVGQVVTIKEG